MIEISFDWKESNVSTKEMIDNLLADYEQSKSNLEIQSNLYQDKINLYVSKRNVSLLSSLSIFDINKGVLC